MRREPQDREATTGQEWRGAGASADRDAEPRTHESNDCCHVSGAQHPARPHTGRLEQPFELAAGFGDSDVGDVYLRGERAHVDEALVAHRMAAGDERNHLVLEQAQGRESATATTRRQHRDVDRALK